MLCPCRKTFELLSEWKRRFGFRWQLECIPWPIPIERFPFRQRTRCERFVFVGGKGGCLAAHENGRDYLNRKGLQLVLDTARLVPNARFLIYTSQSLARVPKNVEVRVAGINSEMYEHGDICIQPSYWEGLGLPLLECQAAGMPLITTDTAPMNEYEPLDVFPVRAHAVARLTAGHKIVVPELHAVDMATTLQRWLGRDISQASTRARDYVTRHHSWRMQRQAFTLRSSDFAVAG